MLNTKETPTQEHQKLTEPVRVVLVGAGNRTTIYGSYGEKNSDEMKVVGVVEPDPYRRNKAAKRFNIPTENCFDSIKTFIEKQPFADGVINGTMDDVHVETTIPILKAGYDVLLEKPIGISKEEILELREVAKQYKRRVMICHVLRFAPFYTAIKNKILDGEIGDIINIQTAENISYDHMAVAYIRGKWNSKKKCKSSILLAKCSHDIDLITWFLSNQHPKRVSSFANLMYFRPDKAPEGAGKRCLVDCQIEKDCPYSAKKNYIEQGNWRQYAWRSIENKGSNLSIEQKIESLKTDNPYGRCVWHSDNDQVDHQSVVIEFENGTTATHNMVGGTAKPCRNIHIIGTKGEIEGTLEDGHFVMRHPDARAGHRFKEEHVETNVSGDMHGGGDLRLVEDFVSLLQGKQPSVSTTSLEDSINGHLIVFAADEANEQNKVVNLT